MQRWPHQIRGVKDTIDAIENHTKRILLTSPTGGGKTRMALDLAQEFTSRDLGVVMYTNRRMLVEQSSRVLESAGVAHGIRAAGHDTEDSLFQVSSIQTENSRVTKKGTWELHDAKLVIIDEAHLQTGPTVLKLIGKHIDNGAHVVGLTATPIGLGDYYDLLIQAGTNSELRQCGALVPAIHYGPDEPDLKAWRKAGALKGIEEGDDLTENQVRRVMMTEGIFGRVLEWYRKLNPGQLPSILFAPGVPESLWFAQQFFQAGITAAHIDGEDVWVNGNFYKSSREAREDVLCGSRDGTIRLVCNRFVLREGIDAPWLAHCIFATIFGSLQSYLQSGGRLLRAHPSLATVTVQDHGGNWWRHGSLNADRDWRLDDTARRITSLRADRFRGRKCVKCSTKLLRPLCHECGHLNVPEPACCPMCKAIINGPSCECGWKRIGKRSRTVVQTNGTLKEMVGDIFAPRRVCSKPNGPALWERMYWRSRTENGRRTFKAAEALFAQENNWSWPDRSWPFMPRDPFDFYKLVEKVPMTDLIPKGPQ